MSIDATPQISSQPSSDVTFRGALVLDIGTDFARIGFGGDNLPKISLPAVVGYPRGVRSIEDPNSQDISVGTDALANRSSSTLNWILDGGAVNNPEFFRNFLHRILHNELHVSPADLPVLVVSPTSQGYPTKMALTELLFETFNFPRLQFMSDAVCASAAAGRPTALVVTIGAFLTSVVPVFEGIDLSGAFFRTFMGGRDINDALEALLKESGREFKTVAERQIVQDIKEKHGFVSLNFEEDIKAAAADCTKFEQSYELPNGEKISLGAERFRCTEILFNPELHGDARPGFHHVIVDIIKKCDESIQSDLWGNIVLVGGSTKFPGLEARLDKELRMLAPEGCNINIVSVADKSNAIWTGAAKIATTLPEASWIARSEYEEIGPIISRRKFAIFTQNI